MASLILQDSVLNGISFAAVLDGNRDGHAFLGVLDAPVVLPEDVPGHVEERPQALGAIQL